MSVHSEAIFKPSRRFRGVPARLAGTDRVLQRWAVSIGDGTQDLSWHEIARSKVPPLDDQTAIVVDQLILRAPHRTMRVTQLWYRVPDPISEIARRLRMDREIVNYRWLTALEYFRPLFLDSPLSSLRRLAAFDPTDGRNDLAFQTASDVP